MIYEIMLSLRIYLSAKFPKVSDVQFMYDGVTLSGKPKPFLTLEDFATPMTLLSAGRRSYSESYNLQLGLYAKDYEERIKMQERVRTALVDGKIPLYDESFSLTEKTFVCDVSDFTPIGNDDLANETNNFHGYFDISVEIYRDVGSKQFTQ